MFHLYMNNICDPSKIREFPDLGPRVKPEGHFKKRRKNYNRINNNKYLDVARELKRL